MVHGEGLVVGQLTDPGPRLFRGRAKEFEDSLQLINDVGSGKQGTSCISQFSKYASSGPHVDAGCVELCAKEHVRRSVPQSDYLGRVTFDGDSKSSGQAKVSQLEFAVLERAIRSMDIQWAFRTTTYLIDEQILWLQISMEDVVTVTESEAS